MATQHATRSHARLANNQTCRNALLFVSAKSTCCVKLHKTAENVGAKPEKCLCELLRCPKHAERDNSTRRFKSRFRLSAAEQAKAHISSLDRVAATWHACANMRSQENQQDASRPVSDWLLRSKHQFTSVRPIRWLRPRMTPAMCSSKLWRYVPLPACCLWWHGASWQASIWIQMSGGHLLSALQWRVGQSRPWRCPWRLHPRGHAREHSTLRRALSGPRPLDGFPQGGGTIHRYISLAIYPSIYRSIYRSI